MFPATLGDRPTVTYTPQENFHGPDGFSYRARDTGSPSLLSAETTVAISVRNGERRAHVP